MISFSLCVTQSSLGQQIWHSDSHMWRGVFLLRSIETGVDGATRVSSSGAATTVRSSGPRAGMATWTHVKGATWGGS